MRKYLPFLLAGAAVAVYFLFKKKAAAAPAPAGDTNSAAAKVLGASSAIVGQLGALFNSRATPGAVNAVGRLAGGGGAGSKGFADFQGKYFKGDNGKVGAGVSDGAINVSGVFDLLAKGIKAAYGGVKNLVTPQPSFNQLVAENSPIIDPASRAGGAAVDTANANFNFGGDPLSNSYDSQDYNFNSDNLDTFGSNWDSISFDA